MRTGPIRSCGAVRGGRGPRQGRRARDGCRLQGRRAAAAQGAGEELLVTAESGAVTIGGTPADDDLTYFRVFRDVSDSNDTMAGDARLHGVKIFFTTDAANDA